MEPLNVWDYERLAAERLEPGAHGYYAGGAGDELTLRDNVEAYRRWVLRPRMLVDVEPCSTATTVLGQEVSMPLLVAPVAFQRVAHPEGEVATARAARDVGTIMCLSTLATSTPAEVAAVGGPCWFQLYVFRDEGVTRKLVGIQILGDPLPLPFEARWPVTADEARIGEVTVAVYSPRLGQNIGYAMVSIGHTAVGTSLGIEAPWGTATAIVAEKPFITATK